MSEFAESGWKPNRLPLPQDNLSVKEAIEIGHTQAAYEARIAQLDGFRMQSGSERVRLIVDPTPGVESGLTWASFDDCEVLPKAYRPSERQFVAWLTEHGEPTDLEVKRAQAERVADMAGLVEITDSGHNDGNSCFVCLAPSRSGIGVIFGYGERDAVAAHFEECGFTLNMDVQFPGLWDWLNANGWQIGMDYQGLVASAQNGSSSPA